MEWNYLSFLCPPFISLSSAKQRDYTSFSFHNWGSFFFPLNEINGAGFQDSSRFCKRALFFSIKGKKNAGIHNSILNNLINISGIKTSIKTDS